MLKTALFTFLIFVFWFTAGQYNAYAERDIAQTPSEKAVNVGNKICPVMGVKVNEEHKYTYEYEGKIYNFCCPACVTAFKNDPGKYIKNVEDELKNAKPESSASSAEGSGHMH